MKDNTDISKLIPYCGKYTINFQLWGPGNFNIYIEKDGIDLWSWGGGDTAQEAIDKAVEYLNRINKTSKT